MVTPTTVTEVLEQLRAAPSDIARYLILDTLRSENPNLLFEATRENIEEIVPILYTPTIGTVCKTFSDLYDHRPGHNLDKPGRHARGLNFRPEDKGRIGEILRAYKADGHEHIDISVLTDGSRILGLGDLGVGGHMITVGKLDLYIAAADFDINRTLPMSLDVGCNVEEIRGKANYRGLAADRLDGQEYYDLVDEIVTEFHNTWPDAVLQFEDFSNNHAFDVLEAHRSRGFAVFNDDIQGTGCVCAAAAIGAFNVLKEYGFPSNARDQRYVFLGAGAAGVGVADQLAALSVVEGATMDEARKQFFMVDSRGLITAKRADFVNGSIAPHKIDYARVRDEDVELKNLIDVIDYVKPTVLIGLSTIGGAFNEQIIRKMKEYCELPVIMALSNPTVKAECTSVQASQWTDGRVIFCSGSPMPQIPALNGNTEIMPSQGNNFLVFPGIGAGAFRGGLKEITSETLAIAAKACADATELSARKEGVCLPPVPSVHVVTQKVAEAVAASKK